MQRCRGVFGVHDFVERIDRVETQTQFEATEAAGEHTQWTTSRTYIRDVCVKCGAVIERVK